MDEENYLHCDNCGWGYYESEADEHECDPYDVLEHDELKDHFSWSGHWPCSDFNHSGIGTGYCCYCD